MIHPLFQWVNWVRHKVWEHARQQGKLPYLIYVRSPTLVLVRYLPNLFSPIPDEWITLPPLDRQSWYKCRIHSVELPSLIAYCRRLNETTLGCLEVEIERRLNNGRLTRL